MLISVSDVDLVPTKKFWFLRIRIQFRIWILLSTWGDSKMRNSDYDDGELLHTLEHFQWEVTPPYSIKNSSWIILFIKIRTTFSN
jgi:hypothetical protein